MKRHLVNARRLLFLSACCAAFAGRLPAAMVDKDADLDALPQVPPGFEVKLVAREPLVRQPCSLAFDARGRLFVGMGPQYRNPTPATPGDQVALLLDADGDGVFDRAQTFATNFNLIQGLAWRGRDLWVANAPDLTVVRDLDGDDVADEYIRVFTDLGNLEHGLHGLNWAPDGKLYMSKGNSKGLNLPDRHAPRAFRELWGVPTPPGAGDAPPPQTFRAADYRGTYHDPKDDWGLMGGVLRCDDMGANLEIIARGLRNPWDIAFDSGFHWLGTDNDQNEGDRVFMPFFGAHFGWNHPWSAHWTGDKHLPTAPVSAPVFHGSGTGVVFYDAPQFPEKFRRVFFINDWLRKTMFVYRPRWDGALLQPAGGAWEPFVTGGASLFRPTDIEVGPDGALWCLGWSRGYGVEWKDGEMINEGRVFRIAWTNAPQPEAPSARATPLPQRTVAGLIGDFAGPLPVWRTDAQEELVRRGAAVKAELIAALQGGKLSEAQETWTAWTLGRLAPEDGIEKFFAEQLGAASGASAPSLNLRIQSLRILAHRARESARGEPLPPAVAALLAHAEPRLRLEAVQAVGQAEDARLIPALTDLAATETDRLVFYAAWQALRGLAPPDELRAMLADARGGVRRAALIALLEDMRLTRDEVSRLTADADPATRELAASWLAKMAAGPVAILRGRALGDGAPRLLSGPPPELKPLKTPTTPAAAEALLARGRPEIGELLFLHPDGAGCFNCHRLAGRGNQFGPDLATIGDRADARHILQSILEPDAVITEGFSAHRVETRDAEFSGVLLEESGLALILGLATGETARIRRTDIVRHETLAASAMPAYAEILSPQHCADIAAWLLTQKARSGGTPAAGETKPKEKKAAKAGAPSGSFAFTEEPGRLVITLGGQPFGEFVFRHDKILRPFLTNLRLPGGAQVTRTFPPVPGVDATDHDTMHPGVSLGFGDISGNDFWRNKAAIRHERFSAAPAVRDGRLAFTTEGTLLTADGAALATLTTRIALSPHAAGALLVWDATITPTRDGFHFGDQEEMGFAVRVATPITEKSGGEVLSSAGARGAKKAWGQSAAWCDYSGVVDGRRVGVTVIPDPANFRPSWWHTRDYGVFVANPFGRKAMKQGDASRVEVRKGEPFRLRFAVLLHEGAVDVAAVAGKVWETPAAPGR